MLEGTQIAINLFNQALDTKGLEKTLLPDEKCKYCGRELISQNSLDYGVCGVCTSQRKRDKKLSSSFNIGKNCNLRNSDPDFNEKGNIFYNAFQRAIDRGDWK